MIALTKHIAYQRWANAKTAEQLKTLHNEVLEKEFGGSFPSIRLTLLHMLQADYRWLNRLNGLPIVEIPVDWSSANTATLMSLWLDVQDQLVRRVHELGTDGNQLVKFTTAKGDSYQLPLDDIIAHVVNHSTYHRGQLVNMMRMAGLTPVGTDYFLFIVANGK